MTTDQGPPTDRQLKEAMDSLGGAAPEARATSKPAPEPKKRFLPPPPAKPKTLGEHFGI